MTCPQQFIIGDAKEIATFAKQQSWREYERASWRTPDGSIVRYLHRIARGSTLHVVGFYDIDQMRRDHRICMSCLTQTTGRKPVLLTGCHLSSVTSRAGLNRLTTP
jgi:hypothetical protein